MRRHVTTPPPHTSVRRLHRCQDNDLALIELDPAGVRSVNSSIPIWGGPAGLATTGTTAGEQMYAYGHSKLGMGCHRSAPRRASAWATAGTAGATP